MKVIYHV